MKKTPEMKPAPLAMRRNNPLAALAALALAALLFGPSSAFAAGVPTDKSLLDLYHEGGPVMHFIALCSIATVALGIYCGISLRKQKVMPDALVLQLSNQLAQRDLNAAYETCNANPGPLTRSLGAALIKATLERDSLDKNAMENAIADGCFREETRIMATVNYLNTFAVLAPMIGLLGTVSGMITSFSALTAGKAEASDLAKGIGEALIATGGGLLLAIPAMFLYFFFRGKASVLMTDVHQKLSEMLDLLFSSQVTAQDVYAVAGEAAAEPEQA